VISQEPGLNLSNGDTQLSKFQLFLAENIQELARARGIVV
jgi:hypothetical protein